MTITRRELFGLAAGGAAVAVLPKAAEAKTYTVEEIANKVWQVDWLPDTPELSYTYTITAIGLSGDHGIPSWPVGAFPPVKILPA